MTTALEPFMKPSILAETMIELTPNKDWQMRTKQGGLIADLQNDPDWISKMIYHAYKKFGPTTLISGEKIIAAIGGDLTKAGLQYDLFDEVVKNMTGFGMRKQDPYQSMRFLLGGYVGEMGAARSAFTADIIHAGKLQDDAALISKGMPPENFNKEYEKLQSNNYRILSEIYKDVQALRELNFSEKEIKDLIGGRRALSKKDVTSVMIGLFNPEEFDNLLKQNKSGLNKSIEQINRTLGTFYKTKDFVNRDELNDIRRKWKNIPLGLSEEDRQLFLEEPYKYKLQKRRDLLKEERELKKEQKPLEKERKDLLKEEKEAWEENRKSSLPASPFIPEVDQTITAGMAPVIDPTSGLTRTQTALLSPSEQVIAKNRNQGIMGLV